MSREINLVFNGSGVPYAIVRRISDAAVWDVTNTAWVGTWVDGDIGDYDIALTSRGGDYYDADFPTDITKNIAVHIAFYSRSGGSPTITDVMLADASGDYYWTGITLSGGGGTPITSVTLEEARDVVRNAARTSANASDDTRVDYAIRYVLQDLLRHAKVTGTVGTVAITGSSAVSDYSGLTLFNASRLRRVGIANVDTGTWGTGNSYAVDALTQGDGSPDSMYYVCTSAHTSTSTTEPPNTSYWSPVAWPQEYKCERADYSEVAARLNSESGGSDRPRIVAVRPDDETQNFYWWPVSPTDKIANVYYDEELTSWSPGTTNPESIVLNIPKEYIDGALWSGAAAVLMERDPKRRSGIDSWQRYVEFRDSVAGEVGRDTGMTEQAGASAAWFRAMIAALLRRSRAS